MPVAAALLAVRRVVVWLPVRLLRAYQRFVSPALPPACRFHPTCSEYAIQALERRGLIIGLALAAWRVVRCNPWNPGGDDPVA